MSRTIVGASPMKRPPSIHAAMWTGTAATNSRRAVGGMITRGTRLLAAPGRNGAVSSESATTAAPIAMTTASAAKTRVFAASVSWMAAPVMRAPSPRPPAADVPTMIEPSFSRPAGASSTTEAVKALVAIPVAAP
jgi:hypothetical protein